MTDFREFLSSRSGLQCLLPRMRTSSALRLSTFVRPSTRRKDGAPWPSKRSINCHFFRADEQATQRLSVRKESENRRANRACRQASRRKTRPQRPLSLRLVEAVQELLPEIGPLLTASIGTTT